MTQQQTIVVGLLDGPATAPAEDAFRLVYAEAFSEPPYDEGPDDVAATFGRFPSLTRRPTFRAPWPGPKTVANPSAWRTALRSAPTRCGGTS